MIRLNYAGRSFLVGTEAGSLLLRYTASRPAGTPADPVALHVFNERGEPENLIVQAGCVEELVAEVTDEDFGPEPENAEAALFLRSRLTSTAPAPVVVEPAVTASPSEPATTASPSEPATPV
jgi:hypothetical protein